MSLWECFKYDRAHYVEFEWALKYGILGEETLCIMSMSEPILTMYMSTFYLCTIYSCHFNFGKAFDNNINFSKIYSKQKLWLSFNQNLQIEIFLAENIFIFVIRKSITFNIKWVCLSKAQRNRFLPWTKHSRDVILSTKF